MESGSAAARRPALKRPWAYATLIALCYAAAASAYILVSDRVAAFLAPDWSTLVSFQRFKGLAYVAATGLLLFVFAGHLYGRLRRSAGALLEAQRALLDSERRATAGVLCLSVAHDCNNMLQVLSGNAYLLSRRGEQLDAEGRSLLESMRAAIASLAGVLDQMRMGGRRSALSKPVTVELGGFIGETLALMRHHHRLKHCAIHLMAEALPPLTVYPAMLHDALVNLLINAGDAVQGEGEIVVACRPHGAGGALIEVHDDGPGVAPALRPLLFEAFNTTKPDGTGLGLLAVKTCAELHGGRVDYLDSPHGGACFRLLIHSVDALAAA
jgi:two-component system, NtrC family, sensor kinase